MRFSIFAALCAVAVAAPSLAVAGGDIQEYERTTRQTTYSGYSGGAYAPPAPMNYARPMGMYYGNPCPTAPYGYGAGAGPCGGGGYGYGGGYGMNNDLLSAGLLGVGLGYLLFH